MSALALSLNPSASPPPSSGTNSPRVHDGWPSARGISWDRTLRGRPRGPPPPCPPPPPETPCASPPAATPGSSVTRHCWNFSTIHRRRDSFAVVDQRLARKQARGVRVRTHPEVHQVETRHFAFLQPEVLADFARHTAPRRVFGGISPQSGARCDAGCAPAGSGVPWPACNCSRDRWAARSARPPRKDAPGPTGTWSPPVCRTAAWASTRPTQPSSRTPVPPAPPPAR